MTDSFVVVVGFFLFEILGFPSLFLLLEVNGFKTLSVLDVEIYGLLFFFKRGGGFRFLCGKS